MNRFTLNQLSFLSGLPQQTILFWNKKYNALGYKDENFKDKYSTDDLHRILNISTLFHLNKKYDLQTICLWENTTLATKVEIELLTNFIHHEDVINQLVASCLTYNEKRFNLIIDITLLFLDIFFLLIKLSNFLFNCFVVSFRTCSSL